MSEKKILFLESEEDNIYRNYASDERETVFQIFFFFWNTIYRKYALFL